MPTYGYECLSCDNQFEITQSIKADPLTTCDACGGALRKRIYPVGISFKGSGFYVNDYAPKSGGAAKADAAPASDAAPAAGGDAKPEAAKPETAAPKAEPKADAPAAKPEAKTPAAPAS